MISGRTALLVLMSVVVALLCGAFALTSEMDVLRARVARLERTSAEDTVLLQQANLGAREANSLLRQIRAEFAEIDRECTQCDKTSAFSNLAIWFPKCSTKEALDRVRTMVSPRSSAALVTWLSDTTVNITSIPSCPGGASCP